MSPRAFPCFMVDADLTSNPKIGRLNDREFRCLVCGVWALAAKADPRGYLAIAGQPADETDVAHQARTSKSIARVTLEKLRAVRMLEWDEELGLERCHDWDLLNPSPGAERTRRWRDAKASPDRHANVTRSVTDASRNASPEVKRRELKAI